MYYPLEKISEYRYKSFIFPVNVALRTTGRIYSEDEVNKAIEKMNLSNNDSMLGELGDNETCNIDLAKVSHKIIDVKLENLHDSGKVLNYLTVIIETLKTPCGLILKSLLDSNVKIYLKHRGIGEINLQTNFVENLSFITFDAIKYTIFPE